MGMEFPAVDAAIALLEKAIKTKPKDTKKRADLHKKANESLKALDKHMADAEATFKKNLDATTRILEEAFGVASSEAKLFDREIVRHLRRAVKLSKEVDRPKDWTVDFGKAAKTVADWDPKAEGVEELEQGIKFLKSGVKAIDTGMAAHRKEELECNAMVDEALKDLYELDDAKLKEAVEPYLTRYRGFFHPPG
jgi:hypothetical protein